VVVAVNVEVRVAEGVCDGRVVAVREAVGVRLGISICVKVRDAATLPSGVAVAEGRSAGVGVEVGANVGLGRAVEVGITGKVAVGANI
jgi:hypothetical protein